jgi:hypothetical protein
MKGVTEKETYITPIVSRFKPRLYASHETNERIICDHSEFDVLSRRDLSPTRMSRDVVSQSPLVKGARMGACKRGDWAQKLKFGVSAVPHLIHANNVYMPGSLNNV